MDIVSVLAQPLTPGYRKANWAVRTLAWSMVAVALVYLVNNYLTVWLEWPGVVNYFFREDAVEASPILAWVQLLSYFVAPVAIAVWVAKTSHVRLIEDSEKLSGWTDYIIRASFWSIFLIGLVDGFISWLRVEDLLVPVFGESLGSSLGKSAFRGVWVHYPLIVVGMVIAARVKTVSVSWLALLVVFSEAWIVIARFIFSYEQTLMGDLVRFWYAGLFLFASAFTLKEEGHVRVDVLYAGRSFRFKAWVNSLGVVVLAYPMCWIILGLGLWEKNSVLNGPLVNFEISQAAYGLYIKYIMAAFLLVFAVSMLIQFSSYLLRHAAMLCGEVEVNDDHHHEEIAG